MGGTRWNDFDTALLLYLVAEPFIHLTHSECAQILTKQTRRRRSMVAVRSKLGELRKDSKNSSLFQEDLHTVTSEIGFRPERDRSSMPQRPVKRGEWMRSRSHEANSCSTS